MFEIKNIFLYLLPMQKYSTFKQLHYQHAHHVHKNNIIFDNKNIHIIDYTHFTAYRLCLSTEYTQVYPISHIELNKEAITLNQLLPLLRLRTKQPHLSHFCPFYDSATTLLSTHSTCISFNHFSLYLKNSVCAAVYYFQRLF